MLAEQLDDPAVGLGDAVWGPGQREPGDKRVVGRAADRHGETAAVGPQLAVLVG